MNQQGNYQIFIVLCVIPHYKKQNHLLKLTILKIIHYN